MQPIGKINGFAERVKRAIRRELLAGITDRGPGLSFADTKHRFDEWLHRYNTERPSQGGPVAFSIGYRLPELVLGGLAHPGLI